MYSIERQRMMAMMVMITSKRENITPAQRETNVKERKEKGDKHF